MSKSRRFWFRAALIAFLLMMGMQSALAQTTAPAQPVRFNAAAVAFDPAWGDLDGNIARMVA